jgi:nitrite reductase (NADH) large subunit
MKLNELISGEMPEQKLMMKKDEWYKEQRIDLKLKTRIEGAEPGEKVVIAKDNKKLPYDRLLIAAGVIPSSSMKGATNRGFRASFCPGRSGHQHLGEGNLQCGAHRRRSLGLEAGNALRKLESKSWLSNFPRLLARQLDGDGAKRLQTIMEGMGFSFRLGAKTQEIAGEGKVKGVLIEGGETLSAEMVIVSAGVRPNLELAKALNLKHDKGIVVDERMRTSVPDVFAAGDVAEFKGIPYGIWIAAMEQGQIAGANMAGGSAVYKGTVMANTLKVVGIDLASAGISTWTNLNQESSRTAKRIRNSSLRITRSSAVFAGRDQSLSKDNQNDG